MTRPWDRGRAIQKVLRGGVNLGGGASRDYDSQQRKTRHEQGRFQKARNGFSGKGLMKLGGPDTRRGA